MAWTVDPRSDVPPSRQLVAAVLDAIASAELRPAEQLPSVRVLAAEARVNHNTVARAYRDLEQLGAVEGQNGRGVFVSAGAVAIARGARRATTLAVFRQALFEALRAGHGREDLERILREEELRRTA